jgi:hypothetical protein
MSDQHLHHAVAMPRNAFGSRKNFTPSVIQCQHMLDLKVRTLSSSANPRQMLNSLVPFSYRGMQKGSRRQLHRNQWKAYLC